MSLTVLNASGILPEATSTTPGTSRAVIPPTTPPTRPHHKPRGTPTKPAQSPQAGQHPAIRLTAAPVQASVFERVTLAGRYPNAGPVTLQVQRREFGSWVDFPTSATVSAGRFQTYVQLGRPGRNSLRVVDPATDVPRMPSPSSSARSAARRKIPRAGTDQVAFGAFIPDTECND